MKRIALLSLTLTACACSDKLDISVFHMGKEMCEQHGGLVSVEKTFENVDKHRVETNCADGTWFIRKIHRQEGESNGTLTESTRG